ncbi:MAG: hypothetical protein ACREMQ_05035 [Longimicrobiales bacterium]
MSMSDRYLRIVLTVIALELGWIALKDTAVPVAAQRGQQTEPTPVVIRGIDLPCTGPASYLNCREMFLPVAITQANPSLRVTADPPLQVDARGLVRIRADQPVVVETRDRPLLIQSVPATSAPRPGVVDQR